MKLDNSSTNNSNIRSVSRVKKETCVSPISSNAIIIIGSRTNIIRSKTNIIRRIIRMTIHNMSISKIAITGRIVNIPRPVMIKMFKTNI